MIFYRTMIIVGQLGRIWVRSYFVKRVFQSVTAIGFYGLMTKVYGYDYDERHNIHDRSNLRNSDTTIIKQKTYSVKYGRIKRRNVSTLKEGTANR